MGASQYYWVQFEDKAGTPYSIDRPFEYLSERSISRRIAQGIEINTTDLPIKPSYKSAVLGVDNVSLVHPSKWINGLLITADSVALEQIAEFSFVREIVSVRQSITGKRQMDIASKEEQFEATAFGSGKVHHGVDYGAAYKQLEVYNLLPLHEAGYMGEGLLIGVMDAGYNQLNEIHAFDRLRDEGRLLGQRDFVDVEHTDVSGSFHGMSVLGSMAAYSEGIVIGSAPDASYWIFRTEDGSSETMVEEFNWIAAAEFADSVGCDIFNTSLGYTNYYNDTGGYDAVHAHTREELDGNTTFITRAGDMAAQKGILVVNSAGNNANNSWVYIGMPADGDSILAVGAVDSNKTKSSFSSPGRSSDPRIKPNVMAMGSSVVLPGLGSQGQDTLVRSNGTSFSGPLTAGAAACLWQRDRSKSAWEIKTLIEQASDRYANPDTSYGYGIPDFNKAFTQLSSESDAQEPIIQFFPNPVSRNVSMKVFSEIADMIDLRWFDASGRLISESTIQVPVGHSVKTWPVSDLAGIYMVRAMSSVLSVNKKLIVVHDN